MFETGKSCVFRDITKAMIIFGIDPGIARVGWAVVRLEKTQPYAVDYGCITTQPTLNLPERFCEIYKQLTLYLNKYKPDCVCVEEIFFAKNTKTAMNIGQARGIALLAASQCGSDVISYTPLEIKRAITGTGNAHKKQIQRMVKEILKLPSIPEPDDTADALAIALTHVFSYKVKQAIL